MKKNIYLRNGSYISPAPSAVFYGGYLVVHICYSSLSFVLTPTSSSFFGFPINNNISLLKKQIFRFFGGEGGGAQPPKYFLKTTLYCIRYNRWRLVFWFSRTPLTIILLVSLNSCRKEIFILIFFCLLMRVFKTFFYWGI